MKANGHVIETLSDYQEKQRRARKVTVGEVEDMITGAFIAMQELSKEMLLRTQALADHVGYVPPKDEQTARVDAVMDAQHAGLDQ